MPKSLTLLNRFDRLNRKHFRGRLKRPLMIRFVKQPAPDDPLAVERICLKEDGRAYILIHKVLKPFDPLAELTLAHAMVHWWNYQRGVGGAHDDCHKQGSRHHRKMLSILAKEPVLC